MCRCTVNCPDVDYLMFVPPLKDIINYNRVENVIFKHGGDITPANIEVKDQGIKQKIKSETVARFFNVEAKAKAINDLALFHRGVMKV